MKTLKLAAIFCVIAGGILLALNWGSIIQPKPKTKPDHHDLIDIGETCDAIRDAWGAADGWDEALYRSQRDKIDQRKALGMFSAEGFNTVNNCLRENATTKACQGYLDALHARSFDADRLEQCITGVRSVTKQEKLENNVRIREVESRHRLYTDIRRFVGGSHAILPQLDTVEGSWTSFDRLQEKILSTACGYRNDALFKEMAHIPGFQDGLNKKKLENITNPQRQNFYEVLSRQIIDYFASAEPTEEKVALLGKIYKVFAEEATAYDALVGKLAALKVAYKKRMSTE